MKARTAAKLATKLTDALGVPVEVSARNVKSPKGNYRAIKFTMQGAKPITLDSRDVRNAALGNEVAILLLAGHLGGNAKPAKKAPKKKAAKPSKKAAPKAAPAKPVADVDLTWLDEVFPEGPAKPVTVTARPNVLAANEVGTERSGGLEGITYNLPFGSVSGEVTTRKVAATYTPSETAQAIEAETTEFTTGIEAGIAAWLAW